jgi:Tfp pilus assembly protein PilX
MMQKLTFQKRNQHGIAMVTVLVLLVVIATLVSVTSILSLGNRNSSADTVAGSRALYSAEAGLETAIAEAYHTPRLNWLASSDYLNPADNSPRKDARGNPIKFDICAYKKWLTGVYQTTSTNFTNNNTGSCVYQIANAAVAANKVAFNGMTSTSQLLLNNTGFTDAAGTAIAPITFTQKLETNTFFEIQVSRRDDPTTLMPVIYLRSRGFTTAND